MYKKQCHTHKKLCRWSGSSFSVSMKMLLSVNVHPSSPSFIFRNYRGDLKKTLLLLWIDSCIEHSLLTSHRWNTLSFMKQATYPEFVPLNQKMTSMNVKKWIFPLLRGSYWPHICFYVRCHFRPKIWAFIIFIRICFVLDICDDINHKNKDLYKLRTFSHAVIIMNRNSESHLM